MSRVECCGGTPRLALSLYPRSLKERLRSETETSRKWPGSSPWGRGLAVTLASSVQGAARAWGHAEPERVGGDRRWEDPAPDLTKHATLQGPEGTGVERHDLPHLLGREPSIARRGRDLGIERRFDVIRGTNEKTHVGIAREAGGQEGQGG